MSSIIYSHGPGDVTLLQLVNVRYWKEDDKMITVIIGKLREEGDCLVDHYVHSREISELRRSPIVLPLFAKSKVD